MSTLSRNPGMNHAPASTMIRFAVRISDSAPWIATSNTATSCTVANSGSPTQPRDLWRSGNV